MGGEMVGGLMQDSMRGDDGEDTIVLRVLDDRYVLREEIGRGRMSVVYRAEDRGRANTTVAVKILNSSLTDELRRELFRRETRSLGRLRHENIVTLYDARCSAENGCYYLVLDYVPRTLAAEIADPVKAQDNAWCWPLMRQLADAVVEAHGRAIIHRDLKPGNVLITEEGVAKLTDFGLSRLLTELAVGETLNMHWTPGYAAPEVRIGQRGNARSDIYSLGCVYYHLLSRLAPSVDGPTEEQIEALDVPLQMRRVLRQMLAHDPDQRYETARQVRRALTFTEHHDLAPLIPIVVTQDARRDLFDAGLIMDVSARQAADFLADELGGLIPKEVYVKRDHRGKTIVVTETLAITCSSRPQGSVLTIEGIELLYESTREIQRRGATLLRLRWQILGMDGAPTVPDDERDSAVANLAWLGDQLSAHARSEAIAYRTRRSQKHWETVLDYQWDELESSPKLAYKAVDEERGIITFTLTDLPPDNLHWEDGAAIAYVDDLTGKESRIGDLDGIRGNKVRVMWDAVSPDVQLSVPRRVTSENLDGGRPSQSDGGLPRSGRICLHKGEERARLKRQRDALFALTRGETENPRLSDVLLDITTAQFDEPNPVLSFKQDLTEEKRAAVRQALAAQDIFLLQGPPGTGKTTTLAEIILQILEAQPGARILVTSQSNVAVDNVLKRIRDLYSGPRLEIVRIGREDKIGLEAGEWLITRRVHGWREEVLQRCRQVEHELEARIRKSRRQLEKRAGKISETVVADLTDCQPFLNDIGVQLDELLTYEHRLQSLAVQMASQAPEVAPGAEAQRAEWERASTQKQAEIELTLSAIRSYLPEEERSPIADDLYTEKERLQAVLDRLLHPKEAIERDSQRLKLVKEWQRVFGQSKEFRKPILARATIVAATCLMAGGPDLDKERYDWAIIDEAGRATSPETLVAMVRAERSIIVGDEQQLPPMLDEELSPSVLKKLNATKAVLTESLFASLVTRAREAESEAAQMLRVQYRMHPAIGNLISTVFYKGQLENDPSTYERRHGLIWLPRPVIWFSTSGLPGRGEKRRGDKLSNPTEIREIKKILLRMEASYQESGLEILGARKRVAVITGYRQQADELAQQIVPQSTGWMALDIEITTIDDFQGQESPIVVYSTVRSNPQQRIGFLRDRRRLNVALSRAQEALIIVGDVTALENADCGTESNPYREISKYIKDHPSECLMRVIEPRSASGV